MVNLDLHIQMHTMMNKPSNSNRVFTMLKPYLPLGGGAVVLKRGAAVMLLKTIVKVTDAMNILPERIQESSGSKYNIDYSNPDCSACNEEQNTN